MLVVMSGGQAQVGLAPGVEVGMARGHVRQLLLLDCLSLRISRSILQHSSNSMEVMDRYNYLRNYSAYVRVSKFFLITHSIWKLAFFSTYGVCVTKKGPNKDIKDSRLTKGDLYCPF